MSAKAFAGSGRWPVREASRRMTSKEIRELEEACPSTFRATLAATDMLVTSIVPLVRELRPGFNIEPGWTADDIAAAAFKELYTFGLDLSETLRPVGPVEDE